MINIDFVVLKAKFQNVLMKTLVINLLLTPVYSTILFGLAFILRSKPKYKKKYMTLLLLFIVVCLLIILLYRPLPILPTSPTKYLFGYYPVQMFFTLLLTMIIILFDLGMVDHWLIQDEKRKQEQNIEKVNHLNYNNRSHMFVVGTTGSGKTQVLLRYILDSIKANDPLYIISGKGSGDGKSMLDDVRDMATTYNRKLYIVSMNENQLDRVAYNPFRNCKIIEIADALCNASHFSEEHYRLNLSTWIKIVAECIQKLGKGFSLPYLVYYMYYDNFLDLIQELKDKKLITDAEARNYRSKKEIATIAEPSLSRFVNLLYGEGKEVIGGLNDICADDIRKEKAILFIDLDSFRYTDFTETIGAFFINDMRNIVSSDKETNIPKRIIMDELGSFVSKQIMPLFSQSRSFGYQIIVATQSVSDLDAISPVFAERIMENCGQYCILQLNSANDAERISKILGTLLSVETTRKSTGMNLHYTLDGSKKVVNAFKVSPDAIKELKPLEVLIYNKQEPEKVKKIKLKYGWRNA